jgi:hypothetical protein
VNGQPEHPQTRDINGKERMAPEFSRGRRFVFSGGAADIERVLCGGGKRSAKAPEEKQDSRKGG